MTVPAESSRQTIPIGKPAPKIKDNLDTVQIISILRRRRALILSTIVVLTLTGTALTFYLMPIYTASAEVLLDVRKTTVIDMQAVVAGLQGGDIAAVRSETDLISSPELLKRVITQLGLIGNPEFNPALDKQKKWRDFLPGIVRGVLFPPVDLSLLSPDEQENRTMAEAVRYMRKNLVVFNDSGRSYTIHLSYTAKNPKSAAQIVNAIARQFLTSQLETKYEKTREVNEWLQDKLAALKQKVEASENAVQTYRSSHNIVRLGSDKDVTSQQLTDTNTQLSLATADAAQKHAALQQFQATVRKGITVAETTPEVLQSRTISELKIHEADAARRLASLRSHFGEKHPEVITAVQELSSLQGRVNIEIQKIIGNMADQAQAADYRVQQLRSDVANLSIAAQNNNQAEVELRALEREAQADRYLYENMLSRFKETSESQEIQQPDASIIASADVPLVPSFPNKPLFVFMALLGSTSLGLAMALLAERLDNGLRTGAQIEELTGVPGIGMLPSITGNVAAEMIQNPTSAFSESVRTIRSTVSVTNIDNPPRIVLVTSAAPEEGKSTMAFSLARASAQAGRRTLLLDCDWRRPSLHKLLNQKNDRTLLDVFSGKAESADVIHRDRSTGVEFIPARYSVPNPGDMFSSQQMRSFLLHAHATYDLVILDSPPVMAAADAMILSQYADTTLFVVRWEKTPRQLVINALKALVKADARLAGVVLTRVNVKKHMRFGFCDHAYYYGVYSPYTSTRVNEFEPLSGSFRGARSLMRYISRIAPMG
jgi:capsular exopolysaccharide synthesis family protein